MTTSNTSPACELTAAQEAVLNRIIATARLQFGDSQPGPVKLRTTPLLIGASGQGKSHLVRLAAQRLGLPHLRLTVSSWMVEGCRHETPTLVRLRREVSSGQPLLLQIDELDKLRASDDAWTRAQMAEIFNLLDRTPGPVVAPGTSLTGNVWTADLMEKLTKNVLIVGSGTWQDIWESGFNEAKPPIGFWSDPQERKPAVSLQESVRRARAIPPELLNRFSHDWLVLPPMSVADFVRLARALNISPEVMNPVEAAKSGLGFRFIENALTKAAIDALLLLPEPAPVPALPDPLSEVLGEN